MSKTFYVVEQCTILSEIPDERVLDLSFVKWKKDQCEGKVRKNQHHRSALRQTSLGRHTREAEDIDVKSLRISLVCIRCEALLGMKSNDLRSIFPALPTCS